MISFQFMHKTPKKNYIIIIIIASGSTYSHSVRADEKQRNKEDRKQVSKIFVFLLGPDTFHPETACKMQVTPEQGD